MSSRSERFARSPQSRFALGLLLAFACASAQAGVLHACDRPTPLSAAQRDRLLRFTAIVKDELERSGASLALVARSGLDLRRIALRYSHAGISLRTSPNTPWSVRQLYYACEEGRPRLFDQGLSGFLFGTDDVSVGYLSAVLLPATEAAALEHTALDNARALALLNARYSANAYAWGVRYQNCNQWIAELLAAAWGDPHDPNDAFDATDAPRVQAQRWLAAHDYTPTRVQLDNRFVTWAAAFVPWLHDDDHPSDDVTQMIYRVSMPESLERFVRARVAGAQRIEFCHDEQRVVVHRGWDEIAAGCVPGPADTVIALDD